MPLAKPLSRSRCMILFHCVTRQNTFGQCKCDQRLINQSLVGNHSSALSVVQLQSQCTMPKLLLVAVTALQLLQVAVAKVEECVTCESNRIEPIVAVDDSSHCQFRQACDQSTPGTGHKYFTNLTEDLITVERCYSFCFNNVRSHNTS